MQFYTLYNSKELKLSGVIKKRSRRKANPCRNALPYYWAVPVTLVPLFTIVYLTIYPLQKWNVRITVPSVVSLKKFGVSVILLLV